jgi:predicted peptidase
MKLRILACWVLVALCVVVSRARCEDKPQKAEHLDVQVRVQMDYLLYLPKDYDKGEKFPLMLFLHGSGERGSDLQKVKVHGPPKLIAAGKDFPFIVVSPQCPDEASWENYQLIALLDDLEKKYKVDPDRIYVTGLSMGGYGTWRLAAAIPNRLAAIVPICGGGSTRSANRIAKLPIWAFHGARDTAVPLNNSLEMVDAVNKEGGSAKLTIYPDAGHDSWTEAYENPKLYEWLLAQKRKPPEKQE